MNTAQIYCDLDGVLVDFVRPSLLTHGRYDLLDDPAFPAEYEYWRGMGMAEGTFWAKINAGGAEWWRTLPLLPWASSVCRLMEDLDFAHGLPPWEIATKPVSAQACAGKWDACAFYFPGRPLHITTDKSRLAAPGRVLIDDLEANCKRWEARGGRAVLFPAKWNRLGEFETWHLIRDDLPRVLERAIADVA